MHPALPASLSSALADLLADPAVVAADGGAAATPAASRTPAPEDDRSLPAQGRLPLPLLAAIGERLAAGAATWKLDDTVAEVARLERWGLQLQALAQVMQRGPRLRRETVDLGLALLQTLAEWSAEAARQGVDLHGPAASVPVQGNPAALKHLLDLLIEHGLQQGRSLRLDIEDDPAAAQARVVLHIDCAPATQSPPGDTLAWLLLQPLARALMLVPDRQRVPGGERLVLSLPRA